MNIIKSMIRELKAPLVDIGAPEEDKNKQIVALSNCFKVALFGLIFMVLFVAFKL